MPLCSHTTGQSHSSRFSQAIQEGGSHQGAARIWCHRIGEEEYVGEEGEKKEGLGRGIEWTRTNDAVHTLQRTAPHAATHSKEEGLGRGIEWTRANDAVHTLQRTATHCTTCCNTLHKALQPTATYCHMLQHPATPTDECKEATADACVCGDLIRCYSSITCYSSTSHDSYARMATHCNTLQHPK